MHLVTERESMVPLYIFINVSLNNLKKLMGDFENDSSTGSMSTFANIPARYLILETVLSQMSMLFSNNKYLGYFLKLYDWNFMEEDIRL